MTGRSPVAALDFFASINTFLFKFSTMLLLKLQKDDECW